MTDFQLEFRADQIAASAFIAANATVLGDVSIGDESSVWFGAVVRGDTERIQIGQQSNIQDMSVLHADPGVPCVIGDRVTIGHAAIVHGATIEDDVLVGMRAVVLNGAKIGRGSVIAAGAVVTEGAQIPPGSMVTGMPAVVRGPVKQRHDEMIRHAAEHYVQAGAAYRKAADHRAADHRAAYRRAADHRAADREVADRLRCTNE
ncbi:gamma carbonic anhydrase family protein [Stieleria sp. TO1_6]|uniref:gamma carbonic anhydrase family protein n=1 Tax=Stieleria tagensis TaxID=2956795 RepID=UPI00209B7912|nr:gamma carbonic anhydrase family protein [Stieleria tagensis]MCO8121354.1 gamma carbonic anhydrase family protein [Stieleria tagensis]